MGQAAKDVLKFWFSESVPEDWFTKSDAFDRQVETRFGELVERALLAQLDSWSANPLSRLALIILLDQFTAIFTAIRPAPLPVTTWHLESALPQLPMGSLRMKKK